MKESEDNPTWLTMVGIIIFVIFVIVTVNRSCNGYKSPAEKAIEQTNQELDKLHKKLNELQKQK